MTHGKRTEPRHTPTAGEELSAVLDANRGLEAAMEDARDDTRTEHRLVAARDAELAGLKVEVLRLKAEDAGLHLRIAALEARLGLSPVTGVAPTQAEP